MSFTLSNRFGAILVLDGYNKQHALQSQHELGPKNYDGVTKLSDNFKAETYYSYASRNGNHTPLFDVSSEIRTKDNALRKRLEGIQARGFLGQIQKKAAEMLLSNRGQEKMSLAPALLALNVDKDFSRDLSVLINKERPEAPDSQSFQIKLPELGDFDLKLNVSSPDALANNRTIINSAFADHLLLAAHENSAADPNEIVQASSGHSFLDNKNLLPELAPETRHKRVSLQTLERPSVVASLEKLFGEDTQTTQSAIEAGKLGRSRRY